MIKDPREFSADEVEQIFSSAAIGIDLGTTNSVIGYLDGSGAACVLETRNAGDPRLTPSAVLFEDDGRIDIGATARARIAVDPLRCVTFAKRKMDTPAELIWPDPADKTGNTKFTPEDVSFMILYRLKLEAERRLRQPVKAAVISVPAWFDHDAREATIRAGTRAGLTVINIISEPAAAALSWIYETVRNEGVDAVREKRLLVYDLGGGTFDISVLRVDNAGQVHEIARGGDIHLGGYDWDQIVLDCLQKNVRKLKKILPPELRHELLLDAQTAKENISRASSMSFAVHLGGQPMRVEVSREEFEDASSALLQKTEKLVDDTLAACKLAARDLDMVLAVGGSTKMAQVERFLERKFRADQIGFVSEVDLAVCRGATLYLARELRRISAYHDVKKDVPNVMRLPKEVQNFVDDIEIAEVSSRWYGMLHAKGRVRCFVEANQPLLRRSRGEEREGPLSEDSTYLRLALYAGESRHVRLNEDRPVNECRKLVEQICKLPTPLSRGTRVSYRCGIKQAGTLFIEMKAPNMDSYEELKFEPAKPRVGQSSLDQEIRERIERGLPDTA